MKYFTSELWIKINSVDKSERVAAELEWEKNVKGYAAHLRRISKKISHDTMAAINEIELGSMPLHDSRLAGVSFTSTECTNKLLGRSFGHPHQSYVRMCRLQLSDGVKNVELIMRGINKMSMEMAYEQETGFDVRWGYSEFSYNKPYVELSVLWDNGHVWQIEISSLSIVESNAEKQQ